MPAELLVCAPLRVEARALRRAHGEHAVVRTGAGYVRSARSATVVSGSEFATLAVAGLGGGVGAGVRSGDIVVATEIRGPSTAVDATGAQALAEELRRCGLVVHAGPIATTDHLVYGAERDALARTGALAVDMESAVLVAAAGDRPRTAVRVVVDTAELPLLHPGTPSRALAALRRLGVVPGPLARWANGVQPTHAADTDRPRSRWEDS